MVTLKVCKSYCGKEMLDYADKIWEMANKGEASNDDAAVLAMIVRDCLRDECE
jgi:hypothetical protein